MHHGPRPRGIRTEAKSRSQIRVVAEATRFALKVDSPRVDVVTLVEKTLFELGVTVDVVEAAEMGDLEGLAIPERDEIRLREDVYSALLRDDHPRARFTVAHEIGHLSLHSFTCHQLARAEQGGNHHFFSDTEWQADAFAAEFLMPAEIVRTTCRTAADIGQMFGVSIEAAIIRMRILQSEGIMRR